VAERARHSLLLGLAALALATMVGVPLGVVTGSRPTASAAAVIRAGALLLVAVPPIVLSLALLLLASRTGWFPVGGLPEQGGVVRTLHHLVLPALALGLPAAAILERLQSRSLADALRDPSLLAARARGIPRRRLVWRHAFRLAVQPVLAIYGVLVGSLISGSFVVEYLMTWPGLGRLMYDALVFRDANLVAGCAAAGALFLAAGVLTAEIALAAVDPRSRDAR
jgi:peptide/nickel transport system permease protein